MDKNQTSEKNKPFRLVKYFTFSSLTVIFAGTIALSFFNIHWARTMGLDKSEEYALVLVENLNHQVFLQFIIPVALKYGKIQLRNKEQYVRMDKVVRSTLHSFKVDMVNIYDMNHTISYSFDKSKVGKTDLGGTGYQYAIAGRSTSKLIQNGNFWQILLGLPSKSKIVTFAPLRAEKPLSALSGPVLGVVEIMQDLSEDHQTIFRFQIRVIITSTIVMLVLFLILIFVVKQGEAIIHRRNLERIRLKEKLNQARRLSALGKMAAGISHEIRNPLGIIKSCAELLKKKMAVFDPKSSIPNIIVEESNRLNRIITDFLEYARPKPPNLSGCRIEKILEKNIDYLKSQTESKGYTVLSEFNDNLPKVMVDTDMMYQAFLNLLINAMQSMPSGGTIRIHIFHRAGNIHVHIQDQGEGIPAEQLERIWDPFFTTKDTGTGLGLGLVKNIIESHKGTIDIKNLSGKGIQVAIVLPAIL
ncbi:ATP-binding protein [Desulfobacterales bacterium HSG16]|nr:ATP-binding protein [Desulfobacterales bacterium HSG16]